MIMHCTQTNRNSSGLITLVLILTFFCGAGFKSHTGLSPETGEELYKYNCIRCHGADGTKGFFGAKNLKKSLLTDSAIIKQIQNGKGFMPSFRKKLTPDEMMQIMSYVKNLRNVKPN
jgi:mono/diheme cytochrome c family protein